MLCSFTSYFGDSGSNAQVSVRCAYFADLLWFVKKTFGKGMISSGYGNAEDNDHDEF